MMVSPLLAASALTKYTGVTAFREIHKDAFERKATMIIKDTIQRMLDSLPDPIPDLLNEDQAALVQSCLISLKDLSQKRLWKQMMKITSAMTISAGDRNMLEYLNRMANNDCTASVAKDLAAYKDKLLFG
jgi:hypothetical protein